MNDKISRWLPGICIALWLAGSANADEHASSVDIVNDTGHAFSNLFLSPSSSSEWGPDLLDDVLQDDQVHSLVNIPCDRYDLMIVEDDGDECLLPSIPLCGSKEVWKFTEHNWLECVGSRTKTG